MTETAALVIKVDSSGAKRATSDLDQLADSAGRSEGAAAKLERQAKITGAVLAGLATGVIALAIKNTMEQERVTAQLEARLRSTGGAAGLAKQELLDMASGLQAVTTYGDESIITAQSLLLTFTKIGRDVFPAALETVLDMSTAMGQDLKSSAIQLGKALNDPIEGVSALTRVGVQFTEAQKDTIERLVETGKTAEAQKIILAELETQMGGSARAARDTLGGALESLKNAFGDLLEGDTGGEGVRGAKQAIEDMITLLNSAEVKEGFSTIVTGLFNVASGAAKAASEIASLTRRVAEGVAARMNGAALDDVPNMQLEAERLRARIGRFDARKWRLPEGAMAPGEQAARDRLALLERSIAEAEANARGRATQGIAGFVSAPTATGGGSAAPTASGGGAKKSTRDKITDEERALAQLQRAYDGYLARLERANTLQGDNSELAAVNYEIQRGALQGISDEEARALRLAAERADAQKAAAEQRTREWEAFADDMRVLEGVWDEIEKEVKGSTGKVSEFYKQAARNIQTTFADFLFDPLADGFSGMADRFADAVRRMAADLAASKLLEMVGGALAGNTATGFWGNLARGVGGAMQGGRAFGGPVQAGQSYRVGERGHPEIFTPSTSGRVTPMGAGGQTVNRITIQNAPPGTEVSEPRQNSMGGFDMSVIIGQIEKQIGGNIAQGTGAAYSGVKGRFNLRDAV